MAAGKSAEVEGAGAAMDQMGEHDIQMGEHDKEDQRVRRDINGGTCEW